MKKLITSILFLGLILMANAQNGAPTATTATAGTLTVTFSTNLSGKNIAEAIYIQDSSNKLINTLLYNTNNGDSSAQDMSTWWSLIGSAWPSAATRAAKTLTTTESTTGATITTNYTNKTLNWGKTVSVAAIPDGTYKVNFEMVTYSPVTRIYYSGTFVKGTTSSSTTVAATSGFTNITLSWVPSGTGIEEIKLGNLYTVYPNPTKSTIFVNGFDIKSVIIYNLEGKQLIKSIEPRVNLSALPRGTYMAEVATSKGLFMKKIVKE